MKQKLLFLIISCLFLANTPVNKVEAARATQKMNKQLLIRHGYYTATGSDSVEYDVEFYFNLSTQTFVSAFVTPTGTSDFPVFCLPTSGTGSTTTPPYDDGTVVYVSSGPIVFTIDGTSITISQFTTGDTMAFDL